MQGLAWLLTLCGVVVVGGVFVFVARSAASGGAAPDPAATGRLRTWLFAGACAAFIPITALSLSAVPYGEGTDGAVVIDAVGHQWYWELSETRVPLGERVVFRVTSADVNHGFAIYDPDLRMVAQTQAMPGYENLLGVRFEEPGVYRVLCLEYCGAAHHGMAAALEVGEEVQ